MKTPLLKLMIYTCLGFFLIASYLGYRTFIFKHGVMHVIFLDVGQGDAIFIITPRGKQILIDAGKHRDVGASLASYMPILDRSLDLVIATHPDLDHIGGFLALADEYRIDSFIHSDVTGKSSQYAELITLFNSYEVDDVIASAGSRIELDRDVYFEVLAPPLGYSSSDTNEYSLMLRLVYGNTSVMLTGDASIFNEYDVSRVYGTSLQSDILKLGHHGSRTSSSELFLDYVDPEYAIVSAGCDNSFGHPHPEVVQRVMERQINILDTCSYGDIVFESDGTLWREK